MLALFGARLQTEPAGAGATLTAAGGQTLRGAPIEVPGDPSSAAFALVAALITPGSAVTAEGVLLNPLRTGLFDTLVELGADLTVSNRREAGGEAVGDRTARHSAPAGVIVPEARAPARNGGSPAVGLAAGPARRPTGRPGVGRPGATE